MNELHSRFLSPWRLRPRRKSGVGAQPVSWERIPEQGAEQFVKFPVPHHGELVVPQLDFHVPRHGEVGETIQPVLLECL